jgi:hypothetical protein
MLKSYLSITMREGMFHYNILGLNLKGIKWEATNIIYI